MLLIICTGWGPMGCEGLISGRIVDSYGRAVNDATVILYVRSFNVLETTTDNSGEYRFENTVWGTYDIKVTKEGYLESKVSATLGESYACSMEVSDIPLYYDNVIELESAYNNFIEGIKGDAVKLEEVLDEDFTMTFYGGAETVCTKNNFCQNCPVPAYVEFFSSNTVVDGNTAMLDVVFMIGGISEDEWPSKLELMIIGNSVVPSWKVINWDLGLVDFKPASEPGKGWADLEGYVEFDVDLSVYKWICSY